MSLIREIKIQGQVDNNNSTSTPLTSGAIFTGTATEILNFGIIFVSVYSDVSSKINGLEIEQSSDGINWDHDDMYSYPAGVGKNYSINPFARYVRVVYTNGDTDQTEFRLQTILKGNSKPSSHRIQDTITTDDDAELVKSVITGLQPNGVFKNFAATNKGNFKVSLNEYGDTPSIDAFARLRISEPFTLFDSKEIHDKQPLFWDEIIGGNATSVHLSADSCVEMSVTSSASDYVIRQTKQRFNYQPGKSQLIFMTFYSPQNDGITSRIGLFDGIGVNYLTPNNGIFFECDGGLSWNIAKNGIITESVPQSAWNVDKMDGTDNSEVLLNTSACQILLMDYEWLGVGRVRVGFVVDGIPVYCHYFNHANNSNFKSVYMKTPNLPLRYSIQSDGSTSSVLDHICSTVISEGGQQETGILRSIDTGTTHVDANAANTTYAVLGIRLKELYKDITVVPEYFSMINEVVGDFRWSLHLNPTIAGTFTYSDVLDSAIQKATGATANVVSNEGILIDSGYTVATAKAGGSTGRKFVTSLRMGSTIAGVMDQMVLCVTPLDANEDIQASLTFREML